MANIIWLDDNAGNGTEHRFGFDALIYFIEQKNHKIDVFSSTNQINSAIQNIANYDLLILDIIMDPLQPSKNDYQYKFGGIDVLEYISKEELGIPIILISVMPQRKIIQEMERRALDSSKLEVKEVLRKGAILPGDLAKQVENILIHSVWRK